MRAFVFPGQGAQFTGMGKDLYDKYPEARELCEQANSLLGFRLTDCMFEGTAEDLKQTAVTQPAVFLHSVIAARLLNALTPDMVAGHSLGEYSALVACGALRFEDALLLVHRRAQAMQHACELQAGTMAAVLGLEDDRVAAICQQITAGEYPLPEGQPTDNQPDNNALTVVAANYNCPGQVVISGTIEGVDRACELLKANGARRALRLQVGGAFHSPLMQPAAEELHEAILRTDFHTPTCPIYQNVDALPHTNPEEIRHNLLLQLTAPVLWTQSIRRMTSDGATIFYEYGPGDVLKGLIRKISPSIPAE